MSRIIILLADSFEEIEAVTIIDVLRRAGLEISSVGVEREIVIGSRDIKLKADLVFKDINTDHFDMIILPGGQPGTENLYKNNRVIKLLQEYNSNGKLIGAICAAPSVLGKAGILAGRKATCYPSYEGKLEGALFSEKNVVVDKNIITSKGPGTVFDFSLEIVKILKDNELAKKVRKGLLLKT